MNANKPTILILILLSLVTTTCSSISSMENKLVGEWQSKGPKSVRLKIAMAGTDNEGFHDGFSSTQDGQTFTYNWRIRNDGDVPVLVLQGKGYWDDFSRRTGNSWMSEAQHKIINLTADAFVVEWGYRGNPLDGVKETYEFQRVTTELRAAEQRANENAERERRAMLTEAPTLLVGSWRDENSLITYEADGTRSGKYDDGSTTKGTWSIDADILTSIAAERDGKRIENPKPYRYQILELNREKFVSKDVSGGKDWHAVRVK